MNSEEHTKDRIMLVIFAVALLEYIRMTIALTALERVTERLQRELDRLYNAQLRREVQRETIRELSLTFGGSTTQTTSGGVPKIGGHDTYNPLPPDRVPPP